MPLQNLQERQTFGGIQTATSTSIPAPVLGLNTHDPLADMDPRYAITMLNLFPDTDGVHVRKGYRSHSTDQGSGNVSTLANYVGADGTEKLLSFANSNIYNSTTFGGSGSSLKSGLSNNNWYTAQMGHVLVMFNGADQPLQYDGSTVSDATYTVIADDSVLIYPTVYKSRLYVVESDKGSIWYGGIDAKTGALTEFDMSSELALGGYISAISPWNFDAGDGVNAYFVIITNMGEAFIYQGSYPGDTSWSLVTKGVLGKPLGRNCFLRLGSDLLIITEQGIIPISEILSDRSPAAFEQLSNKINTEFTEEAVLHRSKAGWQGVNFPAGRFALFNVPVGTSNFFQYVMNTVTGAWARWDHMAASWTVHNDSLYFGGTDGVVYEAWIGANDDGAGIFVDLKTAFNYYGDTTRQKRFGLVRPVFTANGNFAFLFDVDVDFADNPISGVITLTGSQGVAWDSVGWDTSLWGVSGIVNKDWYRIAGVGRTAAIRMKATLVNVELLLTSLDITYTPGGLI